MAVNSDVLAGGPEAGGCDRRTVPGALAAAGAALPAAALLLLAAHFLRAGGRGACVFLLGAALAGLLRAGWVRIVWLALIGAGLGVWADAGATLLNARLAAGLPWGRLGLIMAGIVGLSIGSLLWLGGAAGRAVFSRRAADAVPLAALFLLTAALLGLARENARVPVLLLDRLLPGWGGVQVVALAAYAVGVGGAMLDRRRAPAVRGRIWGLFSAVFFLQLLLGLCGAEQFLMTGELHLPVPAVIIGGPLYRGGGYFMPILFAAAVLLAGPAWCSFLCYIGAWEERLSRRRAGAPRALSPGHSRGRFATLALTVAAALMLRAGGAPAAAAALLAAVFGLAGVGVMVFAAARRGLMVHCTAYCPLGLVADLLGKLSPWRLRIGPGCTRCGACRRACRYGALAEGDLERGRPGLSCSLCTDCLAACRPEAIALSFPGLGPEASRRAFVVVVISLHAAFLGVARM
jgi:ferredoxin